MKVFVTGLLLLLMLLFQNGSCNYAEILWGQCYSYCLTRHESQTQRKVEQTITRITAEHRVRKNRRRGSEVTIRVCRKNRVCKWCLFACENQRNAYEDHGGCMQSCQSKRNRRNKSGRQACKEACNFISRSFESKFGNCPSLNQTQTTEGNALNCIERCQKDVECDSMQKCCTVGCRKVCRNPVEFDVLPSVPTGLQFKPRYDGSTMAEWHFNESRAIIKPIVYVLRWWCPYTPSVLYSITTENSVKLPGYPDGIRPAIVCNFMIAAINIRGSQGFSKSEEYKKKFLVPSQPLNLKWTRTRLHDNKVDVTIRWQPPLYMDGLPLSRFLVFWSDAVPTVSSSYMSLHMHKKSLDGDRTSYTIQRLEPGTVYFVQVRAVVKWEGRTIRGKPVSIHLRTYSTPQPPSGPVINNKSDVYNVKVQEPAFVGKKLQATVTWSVQPGSLAEEYKLYWFPNACDGEAKHRKTLDRLEVDASTFKQQYTMSNLRSNCTYELHIHTVNINGRQSEGQSFFFNTPVCLKTKGNEGVKCPSSSIVPSTAKGLLIRFKRGHSCACQAVISWKPFLENTVNQFSIVWGPSREANGNLAAVIYESEPFTTKVPGHETRACMTYLEMSRHYTVQVISHAAKTKSNPAVLHFRTPDNMAPCYEFEGEDSTDETIAKSTIKDKGKDEEESVNPQKTTGNSGSALLNSVLLLLICCIFALVKMEQ